MNWYDLPPIVQQLSGTFESEMFAVVLSTLFTEFTPIEHLTKFSVDFPWFEATYLQDVNGMIKIYRTKKMSMKERQ
jgi:hypothetical protein